MKSVFGFLLLFAIALMFHACESGVIPEPLTEEAELRTGEYLLSPCLDGESIPADRVPENAWEYVREQYPEFEIEEIERFVLEDGRIYFGLEIETGDDLDWELLFDEDGGFLAGNNDDYEDDLSLGKLPEAVKAYLETNFPDAQIQELEREKEYGATFIEIELSGGLELYFTIEGDFICSDMKNDDDDDGYDDDGRDDDEGEDDDDGYDDDGRDDDDGYDDDEGEDDDDGYDDDGRDDDDGYDDDAQGDLPERAARYIADNYPGYEIEEVEFEDYCDDQRAIEVEIEKNDREELELYFDLEGGFLFESRDIDSDDLPAAVLQSLDANYPGYKIEDDDLEEWKLADGSVRYYLELEIDDDDDLEVVIAADGKVVCVE